jgi:hypothetical protein
VGLFGKLKQLVSGSGQTPPPPPTPQELFAGEMTAAIERLPGIGGITRNAADYSIRVKRVGEDGEHTIFLHNAFLETRDMSPEQRAAYLQRFVSVLGGKVDEPDWAGAQERLVPVLRASSMSVDAIPDLDKRPLRRPFVPFLIEAAALDFETSFLLVSPAMAATWKVGTDELFAAARENAARCFRDGDVELYDESAPYPLWHVARDDTYQSSRLLLPGWLASFAGRVAGRPVAIVPDRSTLIVGGDGDERCLRRLIETARAEYRSSPRRISLGLYTPAPDGGVVPLTLPPEHALAGPVALGHVALAIHEYGVQQKDLQARVGDDLYVATCDGIDPKQGLPFSYTTWTEQVSALLPEADYVMIGVGAAGQNLTILRVPWNTVQETAPGCLVREAGIDPPRWRTVRWPDPPAIAALRARFPPS